MEILFVHGALVRDGAWWWRAVDERVRERTGVRSRAVELPSCGEAAAEPGEAGLVDDAQSLQDALDLTDDAIVVGHSYGGTVMAEGAGHPSVRHLVYITSYLPDVGSSQSQIMADERDPVSIAPGPDGTLAVDGYTPESFGARFWQDVTDPDIARGAWDRVTPQSASAFLTPTTRAAWQGRPSTYLVCTQDRSTSVALQRANASRATRTIELATGHHPFLSAPDAVADVLVELLTD